MQVLQESTHCMWDASCSVAISCLLPRGSQWGCDQPTVAPGNLWRSLMMTILPLHLWMRRHSLSPYSFAASQGRCPIRSQWWELVVDSCHSRSWRRAMTAMRVWGKWNMGSLGFRRTNLCIGIKFVLCYFCLILRLFLSQAFWWYYLRYYIPKWPKKHGTLNSTSDSATFSSKNAIFFEVFALSKVPFEILLFPSPEEHPSKSIDIVGLLMLWPPLPPSFCCQHCRYRHRCHSHCHFFHCFFYWFLSVAPAAAFCWFVSVSMPATVVVLPLLSSSLSSLSPP